MKTLASCIFLLLLLPACGGDPQTPMLVDAVTDAPQLACNPIDQSGCNPNEKCSWLIDQIGPPELGHIGCAPLTGTEAAVGEACLDASDPGGPPAGPLGYDNCAGGAVCVARVCKTICDHQMAGVASGCGENSTCGRYNNLLEQSDVTVAGACDANCNVLDQTRFDGAEACGSPDAMAPTQGCYQNPFFATAADGTTGSCAPVRADDSVPTNPLDQQSIDGIKHADRVDRVKPIIDPNSGSTFKNSCAPGYFPLYFESDTSMKALCTGICAPNPTGVNMATVALKANAEFGNDSIAVKLPRQPAAVVGNGLCQPLKKGNVIGVSENCVFAWGMFVQSDGTVNPMLGPEGEQFGVCFPYAAFSYDSNGDGSDDAGFPNFATLPPRSVNTPGLFPANADDPCDFAVTRTTACTRAEAQLFQALPTVPQKSMFRIGELDKSSRR